MLTKYTLTSIESLDNKKYRITVSCDGCVVIEFEKVKSGISNSFHYNFFSKMNKDGMLEDWLLYHEFENIRTRFFNLNTKKTYESIPGNYEISPSGTILTSIENNIITFYEFLDPEDNKKFINPLKCETELKDDYFTELCMKDNDIFEYTTYRLYYKLYSRFLTDEEIETFYKYHFEGPPYNNIHGENRQLKPYISLQLQRKDDTMFVISTQKFS